MMQQQHKDCLTDRLVARGCGQCLTSGVMRLKLNSMRSASQEFCKSDD